MYNVGILPFWTYRGSKINSQSFVFCKYFTCRIVIEAVTLKQHHVFVAMTGWEGMNLLPSQDQMSLQSSTTDLNRSRSSTGSTPMRSVFSSLYEMFRYKLDCEYFCSLVVCSHWHWCFCLQISIPMSAEFEELMKARDNPSEEAQSRFKCLVRFSIRISGLLF